MSLTGMLEAVEWVLDMVDLWVLNEEMHGRGEAVGTCNKQEDGGVRPLLGSILSTCPGNKWPRDVACLDTLICSREEGRQSDGRRGVIWKACGASGQSGGWPGEQ